MRKLVADQCAEPAGASGQGGKRSESSFSLSFLYGPLCNLNFI